MFWKFFTIFCPGGRKSYKIAQKNIYIFNIHLLRFQVKLKSSSLDTPQINPPFNNFPLIFNTKSLIFYFYNTFIAFDMNTTWYISYYDTYKKKFIRGIKNYLEQNYIFFFFFFALRKIFDMECGLYNQMRKSIVFN